MRSYFCAHRLPQTSWIKTPFIIRNLGLCSRWLSLPVLLEFSEVSAVLAVMRGLVWDCGRFPSSLTLLWTGDLGSQHMGLSTRLLPCPPSMAAHPHSGWPRERGRSQVPSMTLSWKTRLFFARFYLLHRQTLVHYGMALTMWRPGGRHHWGLLGGWLPPIANCSPVFLGGGYGMKSICIDKEVGTIGNRLWRIWGREGDSFNKIIASCHKRSLCSV